MSVAANVEPPRRNGEIVFEEEWERRVFGLAESVVALEFAGDHEPFRRLLIEEIAAEPERAYWHSWSKALERLVTDRELCTTAEIDARVVLSR